ncbi:hypothetical protein H4582DRAFT_221983 [Lactarius indigo]|nr:hypothetical protein H4582DRAFT_221983 [Lactarius indigo]
MRPLSRIAPAYMALVQPACACPAHSPRRFVTLHGVPLHALLLQFATPATLDPRRYNGEGLRAMRRIRPARKPIVIGACSDLVVFPYRRRRITSLVSFPVVQRIHPTTHLIAVGKCLHWRAIPRLGCHMESSQFDRGGPNVSVGCTKLRQ